MRLFRNNGRRSVWNHLYHALNIPQPVNTNIVAANLRPSRLASASEFASRGRKSEDRELELTGTSRINTIVTYVEMVSAAISFASDNRSNV